jgi:hypothetical protein
MSKGSRTRRDRSGPNHAEHSVEVIRAGEHGELELRGDGTFGRACGSTSAVRLVICVSMAPLSSWTPATEPTSRPTAPGATRVDFGSEIEPFWRDRHAASDPEENPARNVNGLHVC